MKLQQILDRIDQAMTAARSDGREVSDRSVSIAASGSGDLIRNWRRSSKSGRTATATLDKITKVAAALNVSADWLMTGEGDPRDQPRVSALDAGIMAQLDQLTDQEKALLLAAAQGMIAARGRDS